MEAAAAVLSELLAMTIERLVQYSVVDPALAAWSYFEVYSIEQYCVA